MTDDGTIGGRGLRDDLARYYDQDAAARAAREPAAERVRRRAGFVALLAAEGRRRVLEVGLGTGQDARALQDEGLEVTGIDQVGLASAGEPATTAIVNWSTNFASCLESLLGAPANPWMHVENCVNDGPNGYFDISSLFEGHEMCTTDTWLFDGTWNAAHPNATVQWQIGQAVIADCKKLANSCIG